MQDDDFHLAWKRLKADCGRRSFVTHPYLLDCVERELPYWLANALTPDWTPQAASRCFRPKANHMLRPGPVLAWRDELVYNVLVQDALPAIWSRICWSQGTPDVAYQLIDPNRRSNQWVKTGARVWKEWREKSLSLLRADVSHVVTTDLTGFYENIDHALLLSELASCGVATGTVDHLRSALRRWASPRARGIPQGYTSSDLLAKLYLEAVDSTLKEGGYVHLRYVDDIRIFCSSQVQARRAIQRLTELVAARGLNLQSAKTKILTAAEATAEIQGPQRILEEVHRGLADELDTGDYAPNSVIFEALQASTVAPDVLESAFAQHVAAGARFEATLFHFLIHRLGAAKSRSGVEYCLQLLLDHPEETDAVLRYLSQVDVLPTELSQIAAYMQSDNAIYDYQLFEFMRWFLVSHIDEPTVLSRAREWAFDKNLSSWLRAYSIAYLGAFGSQADLALLHASYGASLEELERATIVRALARLERSRRNAFYKEIRSDGQLVRAAIAITKETDSTPDGEAA